MSLSPVAVRVAQPQDASDLIEVWTQPVEGEREPAVPELAAPPVSEASSAIARIASDPEQMLLVAETEGRLVGAVHLRRGPISPIKLTEAVHLSHLHVRAASRRRGVATALLSAATTWAEEKDSSHLIAMSPASSRDAHRFLARIGFGQVAVVRAAPVTALRARFTAAAAGSRDTGRLIAKRRHLRRRSAQGLATR